MKIENKSSIEEIFDYKTGPLPDNFNWNRNFTSTQLLSLAKNVLVGRCGTAFWPILGAMCLWMLLSLIPGVNFILMFFGVFFYIGYFKFHLNVIRNKEYDFSIIWSGFSSNLSFIPLGVMLLVALATLGGMILLIIPGLYFSLKYSQVYLIMSDNSNLGVLDVMKESWRLTNGFEWKIVGLGLHMIWMYILMIITLGIASYWLMPRFMVAYVMMYENMKAVNSNS